jgi:hypothetical protein
MKAIRLLCGKSFPAVLFILLIAAFITTGCGGLPGPPPPAFTGNTNVTVLLSSTANDQLSEFDVSFESLSLTNQAGKAIDVFQTAQSQTPHNLEFIHLNGGTEALLTVSVPQGVYSAATASIGSASFTCETLDPASGGLDVSTFAYGQTPSNQVKVNLPAPITITGTTMGLSLNMLVSQSASYPSTCVPVGLAQFSINPTFNLMPIALSQQSTNTVKESNLRGEISSISAANGSFAVALAGGSMASPSIPNSNGQTLSVNTNTRTIYKGISGFSALTMGMFLDMDVTIQADGTQLATRVEVEDVDTTNQSVSTGPLLQISSGQPTLFAFGRQNQGFLRASGRAGELMPYSFGAATFQISGGFANLLDLPFSAVFDAGHLFAGQNVYVTSHAVSLSPGPTYFPAATITLIPQTINGTITGIASDGNFATYTVTLAAYDLISNLAVQAGQTTVLSDPHTVVVYVDGNAQRLNTKPLSLGGVARFDGLLFDDNGIARMDCDQVFDGVAQ